MAVPAVTCAAKITKPWNDGDGLTSASLSATATGSPTSWTWTILWVPVGLETLLSGAHGDFTDGVATTGPGGSSAVLLADIPSDIVGGTIVIQAVATNGEGPSVPTTDKKNGQQCVVIETELLALPLPGDKQYSWGEAQLREVLTKLETAASEGGGGGTDEHAIHDNVDDEIVAITEEESPGMTDLLLLEKATGEKRRLQIINLPILKPVSVTGGYTADYWDCASVSVA